MGTYEKEFETTGMVMKTKFISTSTLVIGLAFATEACFADASASSQTPDTSINGQITSLTQKNVQGTVGSVNPSSRPNIARARLNVSGDFLYWFAEEDGLEYAVVQKSASATVAPAKSDVKQFSIDWQPGFRIGLGYRLPHDSWNLNAEWTRFYGSDHGSSFKRNSSDDLLAVPYVQIGNNAATANGTRFIQEINKAHWKLHYNVLDFEFSRAFFLSKALSVRPFFGPRAAWIDQKVQANYVIFPFFGITVDALVKSKNDYHAGGLRLGSDLDFYFTKYFSIFGEASGSLLYGHFDTWTRAYFSAPVANIENRRILDADNSSNRLRSNLELRGGVKGHIPLFNNKAELTLAVTYDMSIWFSQNEITDAAFPGGVQSMITEARKGDLTLQGLAVSAGLDF